MFSITNISLLNTAYGSGQQAQAGFQKAYRCIYGSTIQFSLDFEF
jgi:hypothetical protein